MDINDLRAAVTLLSFIAFGGIVAWALSRRNQKAFDEAAMLPFLPEPDSGAAAPRSASASANSRED